MEIQQLKHLINPNGMVNYSKGEKTVTENR